MTCYHKSQWEETKTFFPLFLHQLNHLKPARKSVCIVGASDGKFVIPLAETGYMVEALDIDKTALYGGSVEFPKENVFHMKGLCQRIAERNLLSRVEIRLADFTHPGTIISGHDAIFTSCSWHYSRNHDFPFNAYVEKMQDVLSPGGLFCAEYMMPVEVKHFKTDHYVREGQLMNLFPSSRWNIVEDFYTQPFVEAPHLGNLEHHVHRMGFFMAVHR